MFKEAMNMLNKERYDEAITTFNNLLHRYPDFEPSMINYGIGVAYDGQGHLEWAESHLQQAIASNIQNFEAHIFLGNVYSKMGKHTDAIAEFTFVIENNPKNELVPGLRAQVEELRSFSTEDAHARLVDEVEAFRHLIKTQFNIQLDFSPKGLELLNMIMDTGWNDVALAGGFMGEVIIRNLGGSWTMRMPREESTIDGIGSMVIKPFDIVAKKVEHGKALSLLAQYQHIQANMG